MIELLLNLYDLTGLYKIASVVRYGTDEENINTVVVKGCNDKNERKIIGVKIPKDKLNSLKPYHEYKILGERDHLTKLLFIKYLDSHPDERFFQALRNFSEMYFGSFNFIGYSKDGERYEDTFYLECDDLLNIGDEK